MAPVLDASLFGGDHLVRGLVRDSSVRLVAAVATGVTREAVARHHAGRAAAVALGRGAIGSLLLATLTKGDERLTATIVGGGPLGTLSADADAGGDVRVTIKHPEATILAVPENTSERISIGAAIGRVGAVRVVRDLRLRELVSGQCALADGEIDTDLERYLTDSEQIPSVLAADVLVDDAGVVVAAGGILVQALPDSDAVQFLDDIRARLRGGELARALFGLGDAFPPGAAPPALAPAEFLARIALSEAADDLRVLDVRRLTFRCRCSRERARATLALLGAAELEQMMLVAEPTEVTCDFCRERYEFPADELARLRQELAGSDQADRRS